MAEPSEGASAATELEVTYGLAVRVPARQQAFVITVADWNHIKGLVTSIRSLESHWFTAVWSFLTLGVSFLVGLLVLEQQNTVAFGFRASFLALTAVGFTASLLCFISYWTDRRRRGDQSGAALQYMDQIETNLTQPQAL